MALLWVVSQSRADTWLVMALGQARQEGVLH